MVSLWIAKSCSFKQKKLLAALVFFGLSSFNVGAALSGTHNEISWYVDYQEAREKSEEKELPMLLFFSGSDWNGSCMKIRDEVLSSEEFISAVAGKFICVAVDFPRHAELRDPLINEQNEELKNKLHVNTFPSLVLLSPEEREIYKLESFGNENGSNLGESLCKVVTNDQELEQVFPLIPTLAAVELRQYYQLAEELSRKDFMTAAIEQGVLCDDSFFLSEKFRQLVETGRMDSDECRSVKSRLLELDPENEQLTHFTVALIEFQELAKRFRGDAHMNVAKVIEPLADYLTQFGEQDKENQWRLEMIISQYYLDAGLPNSALEHAEIALESAPREAQLSISRSLDHMRHQS
ncbi:thioredoxin family protein [Chlamydia sp.]|uniref:thioredoxin family protein n=1 Tax=Chlamydia sp. TaxID=35827 RepID=UPI0025C4475B|nr:thioredoxin family protein [Chlamydia sp.]MBQ8498571.1 thioredoxin family protein [Chlamydia sp.]